MLRETDAGAKLYNHESAGLISHSLCGSQIPKQAHEGKITLGNIALSS